MPSNESKKLRRIMKMKPSEEPLSFPERRRQWESDIYDSPLLKESTHDVVDMNGVSGEWYIHQSVSSSQVMLYLHGGGFCLGNCRTHHDLALHLSKICNLKVLLVDYRLAPEHPFPAGLNDVVTAYNWLLTQSLDANDIFVAGDSAGGNLALNLVIQLRDNRIPLPSAVILISPWLDLTLTANSISTLAAKDVVVTQAELETCADAYLVDTDPNNSVASPIFADLRNLSPILIQVGTDEILLDDSIRAKEEIQSSEGSVQLEIWEDMWHVWHGFTYLLPEALQAIEQIKQFISEVE